MSNEENSDEEEWEIDKEGNKHKRIIADEGKQTDVKVVVEPSWESKVGYDLINKILRRARENDIEYDQPKTREDFDGICLALKEAEESRKRDEERREQGSRASGQTPLYGQTQSDESEDIYTKEFDSEGEMISYLQDEAKKGNVEAQDYLKKIVNKANKHSKTMEFHGSIKDFATSYDGKPKPKPKSEDWKEKGE